jgi:hypothetical protein
LPLVSLKVTPNRNNAYLNRTKDLLRITSDYYLIKDISGGNMANYGFSYVPEQGYISFAKELTEGDWKSIALDGFDVAHTELLPPSILEAPRPVHWKLRLHRSIAGLQDALQRTSGQTPATVDPKWDAAQTQLRSIIVTAIEDEDPTLQAAGQRLFRALLVGESGLGQNRFTYQKESDHGAMQLELTKEGPLLADAKLIGLEKCLARIARVTQELKDALGRAPGQTSQLAVDRVELVRQALYTANDACNAVLSDIDWFLANTANEAKDGLLRLRAPLQALLDRYPAPRPSTRTDTNG